MADDRPLPVLFLAHGSPMLALSGGDWGQALLDAGRVLPPLRAILVVSAHWETAGGFRVTAAAKPGVLHDFGGFPAALYTLDYPALGAPGIAEEVRRLLEASGLEAALDPDRPLDHGAWVPLRHLAPDAGTPVLQLSLPRPRDPDLLLRAGRALAPLRQAGVLVVGSGGVVHNLGALDWAGEGAPAPWASDFDDWVRERLLKADPGALANWPEAPGARRAVPTTEHLDPLLLVASLADGAPTPLFTGWQLGSLSLASYRWA